MAGIKQTSINFSVDNGFNLRASDTLSLNEDVAGTDFYGKPRTVTTSWVAIPLDGLASFDLLYVKNNDATNYVQISTQNDNSNIFCKLLPGRGAFIPVDPSCTLYYRANTASCVCAVIAVEP